MSVYEAVMCRIMRYFGVYGDFTINEMSEFVLNEWSGGDCGARAEATMVPIDNIGLGRAPTNWPDSIGYRISGKMLHYEIRLRGAGRGNNSSHR